MKHRPGLNTLLLTVGFLATAPGALSAVEPVRLPQQVFSVQVEGGATPFVEVTFALALSEVSNYPVTITAVSGPVEEQLYDGVLSEGFYRLRAPLTKITSGAIKVILRTRLSDRSAQGTQSFLRYQFWEGTLGR